MKCVNCNEETGEEIKTFCDGCNKKLSYEDRAILLERRLYKSISDLSTIL